MTTATSRKSNRLIPVLITALVLFSINAHAIETPAEIFTESRENRIRPNRLICLEEDHHPGFGLTTFANGILLNVAQKFGDRRFPGTVVFYTNPAESLRPKFFPDEFFEAVMVMADDATLRANRLALLVAIDNECRRVADISCLSVESAS